MPFKKGTPKPLGSGRKPNTPNKVDGALAERIAQWCNRPPQQTLALIQANQLPCTVCLGKGVTKFQPKRKPRRPTTPDEIADWADGQDSSDQEVDGEERTCQSCWGEGRDRLKPEVVERAATTLIKYLEKPMPQAVELSGNFTMNMVDRLRAGRERVANDA